MNILDQYDSKRVLFLEYEQKIKGLIESLIKEKGIIIHAIESRVKERDSLSKKIKKKQDKYNDLREVTDTLGLRIITYFEDDVDKVADLLQEQFNLDEENSVDKRMKNDPNVFGYSSLHYILNLKEPRASLPEYTRYTELKFELQIRSILQHAWAEIEHDIGYKSEQEIPKVVRRDFSRIAGLLELADKEFIRLKDFLENYTQDIEAKIQNDSLDLEINKVTLQEFHSRSLEIKDIEDKMVVYSKALGLSDDSDIRVNIRSFGFFDIKNISDLDRLIKSKKDKIIGFYKKWMDMSARQYENRYLNKGLSFFYLFYVLIYENYSPDYLSNYLEVSEVSSSHHKGCISKFETLKQSKFEL
ncbi:(p)ppGpp synthetase [Priestia megaterium]